LFLVPERDLPGLEQRLDRLPFGRLEPDVFSLERRARLPLRQPLPQGGRARESVVDHPLEFLSLLGRILHQAGELWLHQGRRALHPELNLEQPAVLRL